MANNRELSQLASLIVVDDTTRNIGIATTGFSKVGIGTTNVDNAKVEIIINDTTQYTTSGTLSNPATNAPINAVHLQNETVGVTTAEVGLVLSAGGSGAGQHGIYVQRTGSNTGNLIFRRRTGSTTSAETLRIDTDGNVGIGTTNPTTTLQVNGTTKVETSIGSTQAVWFNTLDSKSLSSNNVSLLVQPEKAYFHDSSLSAKTYSPVIVSAALTTNNESNFGSLYGIENFTNVAGTSSTARVNALGFYNAVYRNSTTDVSSYASNILYGQFNTVVQGTNVDQSVVTGIIYNSANTTGIQKATATTIYGNYQLINVGVLANNSASSTNVYDFYAINTIGATSGTGIGTVTNLYSYYASPIVSLTGKVTNYYGLYLDTPTVSGVITNRYSIYSADTSSPMYHAGSIGIGTTNPTSKLHVIGDVLVTGITTSTDFNSSSDINLKDNIERIQNPIDKLQQLDGVTFNWKETHRASVGVIAQQVEKVLPQLVSGDETKTVNYNGLIALLIECVKEQQIEINNLKEKLK